VPTGDQHHRVVGVAGRAVDELGPRGDVAVVLHHDRMSISRWIRSKSGSLRQARFGANRMFLRAASNQPAAPIPIEPTSWLSRSSSDHRHDAAHDLGRVAGRRVAPGLREHLAVGSTTAPRIFVPPMSTPMVNATY
jgi:hypothetical protein